MAFESASSTSSAFRSVSSDSCTPFNRNARKTKLIGFLIYNELISLSALSTSAHLASDLLLFPPIRCKCGAAKGNVTKRRVHEQDFYLPDKFNACLRTPLIDFSCKMSMDRWPIHQSNVAKSYTCRAKLIV